MPLHLVRDDFLASAGSGTQNADASVTAIGGGKYVVTWTRGKDGNADVIGQVFNSTGHAVGTTFQVNSIASASAGDATIVELAHGGFVAAWVSSDTGDGNGGCIRAQRFDDTGTKVGKSFIVNSYAAGIVTQPHIAASEDGSFAVTWSRGFKPEYRVFEANGTPVGFEQSALLGSASVKLAPSISALKHSGYVIAYGSADTGATVYGQTVSKVYQPGDGFMSFAINSSEEIDSLYNISPAPRVATLSNGNFVATWSSLESYDTTGGENQPPGIRARLFDANGTALGDDFRVASVNEVTSEAPVVATLSGGRFVVAWVSSLNGPGPFGIENRDTGLPSTIKARVFNADGTAASKEFIVVFDNSVNVKNLEIAVISGGRFVVSWAEQSAHSTTQSQIHSAIYNADIFDGTAKSDHWSGGSDADVMTGLAGNDIFSGGAGNDRLYGGTGDDQLTGGPGKDLMDGGSGTDTASFAKQGFLKIALDHSVKSEGSAAGDTLISIENLTGSAVGDDYLKGDQGDNKLKGLGGDDRLLGGAGNDVLTGGKGADHLDGGSGNDTASYANESAINVALDGSFIASGAALNDARISIENIVGSIKGSDVIAGNARSNFLSGLGGNDTLYGRGGDDTLLGGAGSDSLDGGIGADYLDGGPGRDYAVYFSTSGVTVALDGSREGKGTAAGDSFKSVEGLVGSDRGADFLFGNSSTNYLLGNGGNDQLFGKAGNDYLSGGLGADRLDGGSGEDAVDYFDEEAAKIALDGAFKAAGSAKGDVLVSIEDLFGSNIGSDVLRGNSSDNLIFGNGGNDRLRGQGGEDLLVGGAGADLLTGGEGNDQFYFGSLTSGGDTISDFAKGDLIVVSGKGFYGIAQNGFLDDGITYLNSDSLTDSRNGPNFLYNKLTHTLWYDANGGEAGGSHLIARFSNGYVVHQSEIFLST
jgi:Ca2+-binding RTX toxin-like protein